VLHHLVVVRAPRSDLLGLFLALVGVTAYMWRIVDPGTSGMVAGIDVGFDVAYVESFRHQLLQQREVMTWYEAAFDGMPLLGHPLVQVFYAPFVIPVLLLGVDAGVRVAYYVSAMIAAYGMYALCRLLGTRPSIAVWAALIFVMSGTLAARLYAGHVERVLAIPLLPWIIATLVLSSRAPTARLRTVAAAAAGILHGNVLLAGEPYLAFMMLGALPIAALAFSRDRRTIAVNVAVALGAMALIVSPKLVAALPFLSSTSRSAISPYQGSQDFFWAGAHLIFPFFASGPVSPFDAAPPVFSYRGTVPGGGEYSWWEYTQYVGSVVVVFAVLALVALGLKRLMPERGCWSASTIAVGHVAGLAGIAMLGAMWLANARAYSPVHWLYEIDQLSLLRAPSRGLILTGVATLSVAALGLETLVRTVGSRRLFMSILALVGVAAVVDVYLVNGWIPRVVEPPYRSSVNAVVDQLRVTDNGPFVVDISAFDYRSAGSVALALAMRNVRVADTLSPLQPTVQLAHTLLPLEDHVRYKLVPSGQSGPTPSWQFLFERDGLIALANIRPQADFWVVGDTLVLERRGSVALPGSYTLIAETTDPPASVVIPANAFAGWSAHIDGDEGSVHSIDGYVATAAAAGTHTYAFTYRQPLLELTIALAALGWIFSALVSVYLARALIQPQHV
jgi:hypothetical protein